MTKHGRASETFSEALTTRTYGPDDMLTRREAARYLGLEAESTLAAWAARGFGPSWSKYGTGRTAAVRYKRRDLDEFIARCTTATSAQG